MKKINWKKVIEIVVVILTAISGFVGGQAAARNNVVDLFNKHQIENVK